MPPILSTREGKPVDRFWTPDEGLLHGLQDPTCRPIIPTPQLTGLISLCEHEQGALRQAMIVLPHPDSLHARRRESLATCSRLRNTTVRNLADLSNAKPFRDMRWFLEKKKVVYIGSQLPCQFGGGKRSRLQSFCLTSPVWPAIATTSRRRRFPFRSLLTKLQRLSMNL